MATLTELRARAKQMKYKGYSKLNKADLEKLLSTPPPKPKRLKSKAEQAKNPVRQVAKPKKGGETIPYSKISRKKNDDGIPIIDVPDSLLMRLLMAMLKTKSPSYDQHPEKIARLTKALKRNFSKENKGKEYTPQVWEQKWDKFIDEEQENAKKQVDRL